MRNHRVYISVAIYIREREASVNGIRYGVIASTGWYEDDRFCLTARGEREAIKLAIDCGQRGRT